MRRPRARSGADGEDSEAREKVLLNEGARSSPEDMSRGVAQLVLPAAPASSRRWSRVGRGQDASGRTHRVLKSSVTAVMWHRVGG